MHLLAIFRPAKTIKIILHNSFYHSLYSDTGGLQNRISSWTIKYFMLFLQYLMYFELEDNCIIFLKSLLDISSINLLVIVDHLLVSTTTELLEDPVQAHSQTAGGNVLVSLVLDIFSQLW